VFLISGAEGHTRAVITDFGLALSIFRSREDLSEPAGMGTPGYMAPEQREGGEVGPLADQYALGVVMCEMLTGSLPSRLEQPESDGKQMLKLPNRKLKPRWERVIRRCLETKPEDRFEDVTQVVHALKPDERFSLRLRLGLVAALLFSVSLGTIFVTRQNAKSRITGLTQLTSDTDLSDSPSLSRDGKTVAYSSDRAQAGNVDIFVQQLPKGRPRCVLARLPF
jgi:eukaryotic-like serine/threonine-protein kinase